MTASADNATCAFLGPESTWGAARIQLCDVQGLWGGRNIFISGEGRAVIQVVGEGLYEDRYALPLGETEARRLLRLFVEQDFVTIEIETRDGLPDEAFPEITLVSPAGRRHAVEKWAGQEHERFDRLYAALLELESRTQGLSPAHTGDFDWDFIPEGFR